MLGTLYHLGKDKALRTWRVWTEGADVCTEYGLAEGASLYSRKTVTQKNIGKANETSLEQQAQLEAAAMYKFKLDRKYSETPEAAEEPLRLPMLAKDLNKIKSPIVFPVDVQPKLDGVRCLAYWENDEIVLLSRGGKPYFIPHISAALKKFLPKNVTFDGEIYRHDLTFQQVVTLVKKNVEDSGLLQYHVYDCILDDNEGEPWIHRRSRLAYILNEYAHVREDCIRLVQTVTVKSREELDKQYAALVGDNYEGAIIRLHDGAYLYGFRSAALLKLKSFMDKEYKIVDAYEGVGRFKGCVTWVCDVGDGRRFSVCPKGTLEEKAQWWNEREAHINISWLKVQFFELTDDGIPRFPVGIGFRLPQDM